MLKLLQLLSRYLEPCLLKLWPEILPNSFYVCGCDCDEAKIRLNGRANENPVDVRVCILQLPTDSDVFAAIGTGSTLSPVSVPFRSVRDVIDREVSSAFSTFSDNDNIIKIQVSSIIIVIKLKYAGIAASRCPFSCSRYIA